MDEALSICVILHSILDTPPYVGDCNQPIIEKPARENR